MKGKTAMKATYVGKHKTILTHFTHWKKKSSLDSCAPAAATVPPTLLMQLIIKVILTSTPNCVGNIWRVDWSACLRGIRATEPSCYLMVDNLTSIWPAWAAVCSAQQAGSADWWVAANDETVSCSARNKYMERDELEGRRQTEERKETGRSCAGDWKT